jgi:hypothetical protein
MVTTPKETNFLYRLETPSAAFTFTDIAENQDLEGETYRSIQISHTSPKFSEDPQDSEIDVTIHENNEAATLFILGPPPYPIKVRIYEFDRETELATLDYKGWVVRSNLELSSSTVSFRLKSVWHFFERESFSD